MSKIVKDIQKLEKKEKRKLKALIIAFLFQFDDLDELASHLIELTEDIKDQVYTINDLAIGLANKHSDINNKPQTDKKEALLIANASLNLARKSAGYTLLGTTYQDGVRQARNSLDTDVELLVATQIFTKFNEQLVNNNPEAKLRWDAQMDKRTCPTCVSLDGNIYTESTAPPCPAHPRCRCLLIPV